MTSARDLPGPHRARHELGVPPTALAEYNLSVDEPEPAFAEYLDAFDIALEGTP